jgi:hypothetical protein
MLRIRQRKAKTLVLSNVEVRHAVRHQDGLVVVSLPQVGAIDLNRPTVQKPARTLTDKLPPRDLFFRPEGLPEISRWCEPPDLPPNHSEPQQWLRKFIANSFRRPVWGSFLF